MEPRNDTSSRPGAPAECTESWSGPDPSQSRTVPRPPSAAFFEQVKDWIAECGSRHGPCPMLHVEPPTLPNRVLKIAHQDGIYGVHLHEGRGEKAWYMTLSHCWGTHRPLTTTKANLAAHLREIEWSLLPRTFQDAVIVTHGFGMEYLWIDSLCIMQDDEDDWKQESDRMGEIYSMGYLNIGAAQGQDSRHGLFGPDRLESGKAIKCIRDTLLADNSPAPLSGRAWVLQERLLSPRVLYFCAQEVIMECSNHTRCQCSGIDTSSPSPPDFIERLRVDTGKEKTYETLRHRFQKTVLQMIGYRLARFGQLPEPPTSRWDLAPRLPFEISNKSLELWDDILHSYCRRKITRLSDRITALAGIAGVFGSTDAYGEYYAGLWEVWLIHMLLWYIDVPKDGNDDLLPLPYSDSDPPLGPSWSWAKVRGSWLYRRPSVRPLQQTLAALTQGELHIAGSTRFREVTKGIISVRGCLITVQVQYDPVPTGLPYAEKFRQQKVVLTKGDDAASMLKDFVLDEGPQPVVSGEEVSLLPIHLDHLHYTMIFPQVFTVNPVIRGLVLRAVEGEAGVYTRIGVFCGPPEWLESSENKEIKIC